MENVKKHGAELKNNEKIVENKSKKGWLNNFEAIR